MCDYDPDQSDVDLYDIPEFPGDVQLQAGFADKPDMDVFAKHEEQSSSETKMKSEDDVLFVQSKPVQATPLDRSVVNNTAHQVQGSLTHVTPFQQLRWHLDAPHEVLRPLRETSQVLNSSEEPVKVETNAQRQQRLLRRILANPGQRKERAAALNQLQGEIRKLKFGSDKASLQISEILKLAHKVASKTENTASESFTSAVNQARRSYNKSIAKARGGVSGNKPSEKSPNSPSVNLDSAQGLQTVPANGVLEPEGKLLTRDNSNIQDKFQRLHHAVNSGATIAPPLYKAVRDRIRQLALALGVNQEIALENQTLKTQFLPTLGTQLTTNIFNMSSNPLSGAAVEAQNETNHYSMDPIMKPLDLTEECHHYQQVSDVPWDIQKYWQQRHSIFSKYDEGICMTDDAWFGVTPEPVANHVAFDLASITSSSKTTLIDLFAGAGGNTIAFALSGRWENIIAIERDASVLACAQHNAAIYGVSNKITWIHDDCFSFMYKSSDIDPSKTVIFASPPWGGPGYRTDEIFNLATMQPYSLKQIHDICRMMDCALYLPRTSDLRQIAKVAPAGKKIEVVQYCMEGASKALVAYIPAAGE